MTRADTTSSGRLSNKPFQLGMDCADGGGATIADPIPAQATTGPRSSGQHSLRATTPHPRGGEVSATTVCLLSPGPVADAETHAIMLRIARALSGPPRRVSVLLAGDGQPAFGAETHDIPTRVVPVPPPEAFQGCPAVRRSLGVLAELRRQEPDLIIAPDAGGLAFYAALLRRLGLGFGATRILVLCLGPRAMRATLDGRLPAGREDLALDHLERRSIAWADCAVSFCGTSLAWMERAGWTLPADRRVLPPPPPIRAASPTAPGPGPRNEILFIGGLRRGDGLPLFVDALRRIPIERLEGRTVTLLGCRGREPWSWNPEPWLATAMPAGLSWRVEAPPEPGALIARLPREGGIVVIPTLGPVPESARECLAHGAPFIGLDLPGLAALWPADRLAGLASPDPGGLAAAIDAALQDGVAPVAALPAAYAAPAAWTSLIDDLPSTPVAAAQKVEADASAVSVVLVHRNRPALLAQALEGLRRQTLDGFEVVLVDDGSDQPEALAALDGLGPEFAARGWRILRGANRGLGAARNRGWQAARGRFVLFHDDDNVALPTQLERLLAAACHSRAAVLTSFFTTFEGNGRPPEEPGEGAQPVLALIGGAPGLGFLENCFGDAQALVQRDVLEALGGFAELRGLGHEDWEFFARAALAGHEVLVVPEVLFRYRVTAASMLRSRPDPEPDYRVNLSPYEALLPEPVHAALQLAFANSYRAEAFRAEIDALTTRLYTAQADLLAMTARLNAAEADLLAMTARLNATEADLLAIGAEARARASAIAASTSFRAVRGLRALLGRQPVEPAMAPLPPREELQRLLRLLGSLSWDATGPLRVAGRLRRG